MKLELTGRFPQVAKFFYGVGQLDRIINMENISVTDPKKEGDETQVKVEVLATAFRMLEEGKGGSKTDKRGAATPGRKPAPAPAPKPAPGGKK
jgi:type IV pilus assembly protein PilO